ncbi:thiamine-phosphate kinase [Flavobacterium sp.]|uniref:thiamine-phosphate kinase n=1 Tax=Flavobacterium sp. TaxID=239 RepID=UPI002604E17E|nr:thiamine-phosphate kinase [Flavobacterium sp.]
MLEDKNQPRTPLAQLGEFGLIARISEGFPLKNGSSKLGIGDDAAVLQRSEENTLITKELLIEGVHFDLSFMPLKHLGYKTVVVGISDLCAMNVKPEQILISIAVSNRFTLEAIDEFYRGVQLACARFGVDLVGGDTSSSVTGLIISVTAVAQAKESEVVLRSTAKETDLLVVTGDIGAAYMGLQVLEREKQVFLANPNNQPDLTPYTYLIERQLKPEARTDIKTLLEQLEVKPTAMIDISDGLVSEALHLCRAADLGCRIYEEKLPLDPQLISCCEEFNIDSTTVALNGGEDYELLFTISLTDFDKIKGNPNLTVIGHTTPAGSGKQLMTRAGTTVALTARGFTGS